MPGSGRLLLHLGRTARPLQGMAIIREKLPDRLPNAPAVAGSNAPKRTSNLTTATLFHSQNETSCRIRRFPEVTGLPRAGSIGSFNGSLAVRECLAAYGGNMRRVK